MNVLDLRIDHDADDCFHCGKLQAQLKMNQLVSLWRVANLGGRDRVQSRRERDQFSKKITKSCLSIGVRYFLWEKSGFVD